MSGVLSGPAVDTVPINGAGGGAVNIYLAGLASPTNQTNQFHPLIFLIGTEGVSDIFCVPPDVPAMIVEPDGPAFVVPPGKTTC